MTTTTRRPWGWLQCLCSAFRRRVLRLAQWANEKSDPDFEHGMMLAERCADIFAEHQRTWDGKDGEALNRACALHKAAADEFMAWHKTRKDRQAKDSATGPNDEMRDRHLEQTQPEKTTSK